MVGPPPRPIGYGFCVQNFCMDVAILVLIAAVIGGGVTGALLTTWSMHRRLFRLEYLVYDQEKIILKEQKRRAAEVRWAPGNLDKQLEELMRLQGKKPDEPFANEYLDGLPG